jgi:hypothetical protein
MSTNADYPRGLNIAVAPTAPLKHSARRQQLVQGAD